MSKFETILSVYGIEAVEKDLSLKLDDEDFFAWWIENISREELLKKFTREEIQKIYFEAV